MIYLRHLATFLPNGTLVIRVLPVMPRMSTVHYVPSLPVTITTAQHVVIHLHPQVHHRLFKCPLGRLQSVLLRQRPEHPLGLHTQPLFPVPGSCPLPTRIRQGILLARVDISQCRAGSRHWGQGPKYPPGTCWIHWEYRQQVTPMCPVGKSWVY